MYFFWSEGVKATVTWRNSKWSNPCYSGPEYMFRGNYLQDSRGGVITPRILGGVFTPRILGGVNNPNNPPYIRQCGEAPGHLNTNHWISRLEDQFRCPALPGLPQSPQSTQVEIYQNRDIILLDNTPSS